MNYWERAFVDFSIYFFFGDFIFINVASACIAIWMIAANIKTIDFKRNGVFAAALLISPFTVIFLFISYIYYPGMFYSLDSAIIPSILFVGFALSVIELYSITQRRNQSILASMKESPKGILGGLLTYLAVLMFCLYLYNKNYQSFGMEYVFQEPGYCRHPSWTIQGSWAWGFYDFTFSSWKDVIVEYVYYSENMRVTLFMLLGSVAPIIFALNGFILRQGRKMFSFLISLQIIVIYAFLPFVHGVFTCD